MTDEEVLQEMIYRLIERAAETTGEENNDFVYGMRTVCVEMLELIQKLWREAKNRGLAFDIERVFPL